MRRDLPYRARVFGDSKGKITLRVRTGGYRGNKTWGADVYTNDPTWKQFNLIVKAYVETLLTVSPAYVTLHSTGNVIITREVENLLLALVLDCSTYLWSQYGYDTLHKSLLTSL